MKLNIVRFEPESEPKGILQIIHGFGEHKGSYKSLAEYFNKHEYAVVAYDQRGHGDLPKKSRGIVGSYDYFLDDIKEVRYKIKAWYPDKPVILYGHSMGGNIALSYLLKRSQNEYVKAIMETPWLRLYRNQPKFFVRLARVLSSINPNLAVESKLVTDSISRNPEKVNALRNDKLYHGRMSLRIFPQIVDAGEYILCNAEKLEIPVLLFGGDDDRIVCVKAIRELANKNKNTIIYREVPQGRHVLRDDIEPAKSETLKYMLDFCNHSAKTDEKDKVRHID